MHLTPIEINKSLKGISLPANNFDIAEYIRERGAGPDLMQAVSKLPGGTYCSIRDISRAIDQNL